jgi:hypothetical protein
MFKLTSSNFTKNALKSFNKDINKFTLFKNNCNFKNFSIKSGSAKHNNGLDFFESNFKIETPPEHMPAVRKFYNLVQ